MTRLPQVLVNVPNVDKSRVSSDEGLQEAIADAERELDGRGRVLLRASGTEQLVRVMVEAPDPETADRLAASLAGVVEQRLGL